MTKRILVLLFILWLGLLSGCWDLREINASVIATGIGIDLADDNRIAFSAQLIHPTNPSESGSNIEHPVTISSADYGVSMAARRLMLSLSLVPEWAHVKTVLVGERLMQRDLSLCIDFMTRNRNIRPDTRLMVCVSAKPEEVLSSQLPQGTNLGAGLTDILNHSEQQLGIYVPITLEEFTYRLATPGIEPAVPQITLVTEKNTLKPAQPGMKPGNSGSSSSARQKPMLNGMAVFKKNKLVGSLNEYESQGYRWLSSNSKQGGFFTIKSPIKPAGLIGLEIIDFSSKVKPQISGNNITMKVEVTADLGFYEEDGTGELLTPATIKRLEQSADLEIKRQITACINKSQSLQSDILGWGQAISINEPGEWKELYPQWSNIYPFVGSDIQVKSQISRSNLSAKSFRFQ